MATQSGSRQHIQATGALTRSNAAAAPSSAVEDFKGHQAQTLCFPGEKTGPERGA